MSSLLQFNGAISRKGVQLPFFRTIASFFFRKQKGEWVWHTDENTWEYEVYDFEDVLHTESTGDIAENVPCSICRQSHPRIALAWRKPRGMFGPWVVFEYNGKKHVPDLSIPIGTFKIPRDAIALTDDENGIYRHK